MSQSPADKAQRTGRLAAMAEARVRQVESVVAQASAQVERARTKQAELAQYLADYGQTGGGQAADGAVSAASLRNRCAFVAKLTEACHQQAAVVTEAGRRLDQARQRLVSQQQHGARYDALHAAARADADADSRRREQREADEAAITQWQRRV